MPGLFERLAAWLFGPAPPLSPEDRAKRLLRRLLSQEERDMLDKFGGFYVLGASGQRYWLKGGGIFALDRDRIAEYWCVVPKGSSYLPSGDIIAAQVAHLKSDDRALYRLANVSTFFTSGRRVLEHMAGRPT